MGRKSSSGSGIRDEQHRTYFLELRNHFLGLKYFNSLMRIRDPGLRQFGSGMEKVGSGINIPDQHYSKRRSSMFILDVHPGSWL
jgi:hypothetical protein